MVSFLRLNEKGASMTVAFDFVNLPVLADAQVRASGINDFGIVIGVGVFPVEGVTKGFLYFRGQYYTFKAPPYCSFTTASSLNNSGGAVGTNQCGPGAFSDWLFLGGHFQTFNVPGAQEAPPTGVNDLGVVVGTGDEFFGTSAWRYANGHFTSIDVPGANETYPQGINDFGQIVGSYHAGSQPTVAYVQTGGVVSNINLPTTTSSVATGINNLGEIVGYQGDYDFGEASVGFVDIKGRITTVSYPGAASTEILGVNDLGQIVGNYETPDGRQFSFVATPRK